MTLERNREPSMAAINAIVAVAVVILVSIPFADGAADLSSPELVFVASLAMTLIVPPVQVRVRRLVSNALGVGQDHMYDLLALAPRFPVASPAEDGIFQLAEALRSGLSAEAVAISTDLRRVVAGSSTRESPSHTATVVHMGESVAVIDVFRDRELSASATETLDDIAASAGVVIANASTIFELRRQAELLRSTIANIEARRRAIVVAELEGRERLAVEIVRRVNPAFERMRHAVTQGNLNDAALACEELVDQLRKVSGVLRR